MIAPAGWSVPGFYQPLAAFGRRRLYQVPTSGYFDLVGSDLAFAGDPRDLYPAAAAWLASDLPQLKQHPTVRLDRAASDDPSFLPLSRAAQVIAQTPIRPEPPRGPILSEAVASDGYLAQVDHPVRNRGL